MGQRADRWVRRRLERALASHVRPGEVLVSYAVALYNASESSPTERLFIRGDVLLALTNQAVHIVQHRLLGSFPLVQVRDVITHYSTLEFVLEPDGTRHVFTPDRGMERADRFIYDIFQQLFSFQDVELSVPAASGPILTKYYAWRPGCPASLQLLSFGADATEDEVGPAVVACISAAHHARRDEPLDPEWDKDPGTGEHLRMRVRRLNDEASVRVLPAFYMLSSGGADPIWLACSETAFYWIPRREAPRTEPFTVLPWHDLETNLTRITQARSHKSGQNVPMLQLAIRRGVPALHGWLPDDPDALPTSQIILDGGAKADVDDLLLFVGRCLRESGGLWAGDLWG
jgi:hypothetical protein